MAVSSASNPRLKPKKPLDVWSIREKLCLASAVFKIGDQNWVSVSRAIKPYAEPSRPPEWFHQKNCLLQYYDLMEQLEQPKRKRGGDRSESDTPSLQIMRRMTIERSEQLKKEILEMQQTFKHVKSEVESIKAGLWDDHIEDIWQEIQQEERNSETQQKIEVKIEDDYDESKASVAEISDTTMPVGDIDDSTQDTVGDISVLTDEEGTQSGNASFQASIPVSLSSTVDIKLSSTSHLLTLLKSKVKTATELQQLKHEQEQEHVQQHTQSSQQPLLSQAQRSLQKTPVTQDDPLTTSPSSTAPTLSRLLSTAKSHAEVTSVIKSAKTICDISGDTLLDPDVTTTENIVEETERTDVGESNLTAIASNSFTQHSDIQTETMDHNVLTPAIEDSEEAEKEEVLLKDDGEQMEEEQVTVASKYQDVETINTVKEELDNDSQDDDEDPSVKKNAESFVNDAEVIESVKDEPLSPTSSISSKISDAGSKRGIKIRGRPLSTTRSSIVSSRKSYNTEDDDRKDEGGSSQHSDVELSEDDIRESDDILTGQRVSVNVSSILSESFPNSPASLSICSDTEEEKSFKQWKKSIMLVWRAAATHKYANVFLHPVTDEIASGYHSVVLRPMDLSTIKKNVETGIIRSTVDFQHDMMLMFTNAIMYNSSDHNVFRMAKEMYDDVMQHIEMMIQTSDAKNLRQSRRTDTSDKEDEARKRKLSVDQSEGGGKTKKRKIRVDESHS